MQFKQFYNIATKGSGRKKCYYFWWSTWLFSRQLNCRSLRCSWSIACRRCSNYIFILDLTLGFNGLSKDNYMVRRETFKFRDLVRLIVETLRYIYIYIKICIMMIIRKYYVHTKIRPSGYNAPNYRTHHGLHSSNGNKILAFRESIWSSWQNLMLQLPHIIRSWHPNP